MMYKFGLVASMFTKFRAHTRKKRTAMKSHEMMKWWSKHSWTQKKCTHIRILSERTSVE